MRQDLPFMLNAVDAVVFGYEKGHGLKLLLIQRENDPFKNCWALPGGLVKTEESIEEAAKRELVEETGVQISHLEQLYTFGKPDRDPRNRVVSIAYLGLVKPKHHQLKADTDAIDARWFSIDALPDLAFDHLEIIEVAIKRLRGKATYEPIGFDLLDDKFPFADLEELYRIFLNRDIDRRNFRKKVLQFDFVEELDEKAPSTGKGRKGNLFRFNKEKYDQLVQKGIFFDI